MPQPKSSYPPCKVARGEFKRWIGRDQTLERCENLAPVAASGESLGTIHQPKELRLVGKGRVIRADGAGDGCPRADNG